MKYPGITVKIITLGNCTSAIISRVSKGLKQAGIEKSEIEKFVAEANASNNVIQTAMQWVDAR